jgi:hypothetical protein
MNSYFQQVLSVGVLLSANIPYNSTMETDIDICGLTDEVVCVGVSHGWSDINIKLAATYRLFSSDRKTLDSLSYTWHIPSEERWLMIHAQYLLQLLEAFTHYL